MIGIFHTHLLHLRRKFKKQLIVIKFNVTLVSTKKS